MNTTIHITKSHNLSNVLSTMRVFLVYLVQHRDFGIVIQNGVVIIIVAITDILGILAYAHGMSVHAGENYEQEPQVSKQIELIKHALWH